jgi:hypothetical protein
VGQLYNTRFEYGMAGLIFWRPISETTNLGYDNSFFVAHVLTIIKNTHKLTFHYFSETSVSMEFVDFMSVLCNR